MLRESKRHRQIHQLLDDELHAHEREAVEKEMAQDPALSAEFRQAEQVRKRLRAAASLSLSGEEAEAFDRRLRQRLEGISPVRSPFSLFLSVWDAVSFPVWRPAVTAAMVAVMVLLFPVSRRIFQPEIGLEATAAFETDIPDARVLILSGEEDGTDRVWILAGDTS